MVTTNDPALRARLAALRSHGIVRDRQVLPFPDDPWCYAQVDLGFNYRLTDFQAALGLSQLARLGGYVARRNALAERYDRLLADLPMTPLARSEGRTSAFHLYVVRFADAGERRRVFDGMVADDIRPQVHYIPIHLQPYYRALGFAAGDFPAAEDHYARSLSLPLYPTLAEADQDRVVACLAILLGGAR